MTEARKALERRNWAEVYRLLRSVDAAELSADDLDVLADASWAVGDHVGCQRARQQAHITYLADGDDAAAAWTALAVAGHHLSRGDLAVAQGWRATAERLLEGLPECPAHGRMLYGQAYTAGNLFEDLEPAVDLARQAAEVAKRVGPPEIEILARNLEGRFLALLGHADTGLVLMDETTAVAMSGRLAPWASMPIACLTISTCQQLGDNRRAAQWIEAYDQATVGLGLNFSPDCRIHRALALRDAGSWARAEAEARLGCADDRFGQQYAFHSGWGWNEIGVIRLRTGDLAGAEDAFVEAHRRGYPPHPGLALVRLARGDVDAACAAIAEALTTVGPSGQPVTSGYPRARLYAAAVRILVTAGDLAAAGDAAEQVTRIAEQLGFPLLEALRDGARGEVALAAGDADAAVASLRAAVDTWTAEDMPYEAASGRLLLARALLMAGAPDAATLEARAAGSSFARLGAVLDEQEARRFQDHVTAGDGATPVAATVERAFMFTDIVRSSALAEAMGDEAWRTVLRRHDALVDACVRDHGGRVVKHEGDGVFAAFPGASVALECGFAIQETLARQRQDGFMPEVRIGVHHGHAIEEGGDYFGTAVNATARIMSLAQGGEVVASIDAAGEAGRRSPAEDVELKGLSQPVTVVRFSRET